MGQFIPSVKIAGNHVVDLDYNKRHNETFIYPPLSHLRGKFTTSELTSLILALKSEGFDVIGGHEYSVAVTGDIILKLANEWKESIKTE